MIVSLVDPLTFQKKFRKATSQKSQFVQDPQKLDDFILEKY
jgi:hypothetical protein